MCISASVSRGGNAWPIFTQRIKKRNETTSTMNRIPCSFNHFSDGREVQISGGSANRSRLGNHRRPNVVRFQAGHKRSGLRGKFRDNDKTERERERGRGKKEKEKIKEEKGEGRKEEKGSWRNRGRRCPRFVNPRHVK